MLDKLGTGGLSHNHADMGNANWTQWVIVYMKREDKVVRGLGVYLGRVIGKRRGSEYDQTLLYVCMKFPTN